MFDENQMNFTSEEEIEVKVIISQMNKKEFIEQCIKFHQEFKEEMNIIN